MSNHDINYKSYTRGISGIKFNSPVSFSRIEMEEINIGDSNSISGYTTGINIGSRNLIFSNLPNKLYTLVNLTGITGNLPGQTIFTGVTGQELVFIGSLPKKRNVNFGYENYINNGEEAHNFGSNNISSSGLNLLQVGINSNSSFTKNGVVVGIGNISTSGDGIAILGNSNNVNKFNNINLIGNLNKSDSYSANIFGDNNNLLEGKDGYVTVIGTSNLLKNSYNSTIVGNNNYFSGTDTSYVFGNNNLNMSNSTGNNNYDNLILGTNNSILRAQKQIIVGDGIISKNSYSNILFGKNISANNQNNISFGASNEIDGSNELVYGTLNILNLTNSDVILGVLNSLSGTSSNTIIGSNNRADRTLLDNLYLRPLTGVTGLGVNQTPFTGVTGYFITGGYTGIDANGGTKNFIVGESNLTTLNNKVYTFGNDNKLLNNINTYVFGANNFAEKSNTSYIFGESNSVSGFQNYVIGNSNEARSGDYNSIFIGINHTPTGANKVSTISLATASNKIEINPSEIRLDSVNRPKINGENIIIQSEFDTISNALNQGGSTFSTNTFQDANYDKFTEKILVSSFNYDSGVETSLVSDAQEFNSTSNLVLNNFNIFSTTSYTGANGFNIIYGNHTSPKFPPTWIVVDKLTSGVYYRNDITPFSTTPQSGWYATGFRAGTNLYTGTSNDFGVNLIIGTRSGYMSVNTSSFGTFYIPIFY